MLVLLVNGDEIGINHRVYLYLSFQERMVRTLVQVERRS